MLRCEDFLKYRVTCKSVCEGLLEFICSRFGNISVFILKIKKTENEDEAKNTA